MCGLVGAMGNMGEPDAKALKMLMIFDTVRGEHSTGLAMIGKNDKGISLAKEVGDPFRLFDSFDCFNEKGLVKDAHSYSAFIGHNRFATKGAINAENAHPFHHGRITGAHNGTLRGAGKLDEFNKFEVDSEAIFFNLSTNDPKEVVPKINGAYALTWYNSEEKRMYFIRNHERPLFLARRKDNDVIFWASEEWMLELALERNGISHHGIERFVADTLYSFDLGDMSHAALRSRKLTNHGVVKGWVAPPVISKVKGTGVDRNSPFLKGDGFSYPDWWAKQLAKAAGNGGEKKVIGGSMPLEDMRKLIGQEVLFTIADDCLGLNGLQYVYGNPSDGRDYEIRIFGSHLPQWNDLVHLSVGWTATIKGAVELHQNNGTIERYITVDNRSIKEAKWPKKEEETKDNVVPFVQASTNLYKGWEGSSLTKEEWMEATKCGCSWCGMSVFPEDASTVVFADPSSPICEFCQQLEEVQMFINMTGVTRNIHVS